MTLTSFLKSGVARRSKGAPDAPLSTSPLSAVADAALLARLGSDARSRLADDAARALAAAPADARLSFAQALGLPRNAAGLAREGAALFALFIDDDVLRPKLGEAAIEVWLPLDAAACTVKALGHAEAWTVEMLVTLCLGVDAAEAFDAMADRYRVDERLRKHLGNEAAIGSFTRVLRDERFVDLALQFLSRSPGEALAAVGLLAMQGSPRAREELRGVVCGAASLDAVALLALEGLIRSGPHDEMIDVVARVLCSSLGEELVGKPGAVRWFIGSHRDELLRHELVQERGAAAGRVERIAGPRRSRPGPRPRRDPYVVG